MAQAVANWQFPQSLKPDGMAGPRTLPRMFESGLAEKKSREAVVKTTEAVQHDWKDLKTAEARAAKLYEGVKAQLEAAGVKPDAQARGQGPREDRRPVRAQGLDDLLRRRLVLRRPTSTTTVHETLQAPSTTRPGTPSRATRWRACWRPRATTPEQISAKMELPIDVATERARQPAAEGRRVRHRLAAVRLRLRAGQGAAREGGARGGDVRRAAGGQAGRGRQPDAGEQGALPAAGGRVPRLPRPARPRTTRSAPSSPSRRAGTRRIPKKPCC